MRKLNAAEIRFLSAVSKTYSGVMRPFQVPKNTNCMTIKNLWKMGMLKLGPCQPWEVPCSLTDAGKAALNTANPEGLRTRHLVAGTQHPLVGRSESKGE